MIARLFREVLAREASRYLTRHRIRKERALIREVTRQMRRERGLPPSPALEG